MHVALYACVCVPYVSVTDVQRRIVLSMRSRYFLDLFLKAPNADEVTVSGVTDEALIEVLLSAVKCGLCTVNVRAKGSEGVSE